MNTRYVNTASSAGGNGTTNGTAGATRAYASMAEWEAARQAVLADSEEVQCCGTAADTTSCTVAGWTTTASFYISIVGNPTDTNGAHAGTWSTSKYRMEIASAAGTNGVWLAEEYSRVASIQVQVTQANVVAGGGRFCYLIDEFATSDMRVEQCIAKGVVSGTNTVGLAGFFGNNGVVRNCLAYDFVNAAEVDMNGFLTFSSLTGTYQNCTGHNCYDAFKRGGGTMVATNCGAAAFTHAGFQGTITQTTCSSTTPTFANEAGDDFHLASGDTTWKGQGTDLSGTFTIDIDGETRSAPWDIGADEVIVAATPMPFPVYQLVRGRSFSVVASGMTPPSGT